MATAGGGGAFLRAVLATPMQPGTIFFCGELLLCCVFLSFVLVLFTCFRSVFVGCFVLVSLLLYVQL